MQSIKILIICIFAIIKSFSLWHQSSATPPTLMNNKKSMNRSSRHMPCYSKIGFSSRLSYIRSVYSNIPTHGGLIRTSVSLTSCCVSTKTPITSLKPTFNTSPKTLWDTTALVSVTPNLTTHYKPSHVS